MPGLSNDERTNGSSDTLEISAAEQIQMIEQVVQVVEVPPLGVARRKRTNALVCLQEFRTETPE